MREVIYDIEPTDIYWEMKWNQEKFPNQPEIEIVFEQEYALAHLLINEIININSFWYEDGWPKEAQEAINIFVNCNDVFAWGCADAERLLYNDIEDLYKHFIKDPSWGSAVWCIKKRNMMPQKPVYDRIMQAGIWNLDEMNLEPNPSWKLFGE